MIAWMVGIALLAFWLAIGRQQKRARKRHGKWPVTTRPGAMGCANQFLSLAFLALLLLLFGSLIFGQETMIALIEGTSQVARR